ncbi:MAG: beta-N-acetylhexosaminidase [Clostridia bacterium]|nr:beta-N-acetylhexosaminidase [Clostridia bacterium]
MKHFDSLGVMIDCSRNAVPNVKGLKRFFEITSKMGYNTVMLYTEDTYEVENEPYFGHKRGRYSIEELKELDAYASSLGLEMIPFIQTLAHLATLKRWRAYRHKVFDIDDILLIDEPRTYELIENIFATLAKTFSSRRVHLGLDEAHHVGLGKYLDTHGYTDRYALLLKHLNRVCEIARKYGFETMMMANDLFFNMAPGVFCTDEIKEFPAEITENIPKDLAMVHWDYFGTDEKRYDAMLLSSKKLSDQVWFSGGAWTWGTFSPHNRYSIGRNEIAIASCKKNGIRKAFFTLWGDNGGECPYFSVLPALMHIAALANDMSETEMKNKFKEITGISFDDFLTLDLPNYIFGENVTVESPYFQHSPCNYAKTYLYDDPFLASMSVNTKINDTDVFGDYAVRLAKLADEKNEFSYLFSALSALCSVLEIKFALGKRTRTLYENGDKEGLRKLAETEYTNLLPRLEDFYRTYRKQWYTVNKSYGFEIQDIRLGGLSRRIQNCKEILISYANGEIDRIEELEEQPLPMKDTYITSWAEMVSANIV